MRQTIDLGGAGPVALVQRLDEKLSENEQSAMRAREWAQEAGFDERMPDQYDELTSLLGLIQRTFERLEDARRSVRTGADGATEELASLWRTANVLEERVTESPLVGRFRSRV